MAIPGADDIRSMIAARDGLLSRLEERAAEIQAMTEAVVASVRAGGTLYACGNGGSATQAQHFVSELVGRFKIERRAMRAVSLSDNAAAVTAIANDFSYADVFARQLDGLTGPGDCLLAVSTSGTSDNVLRACRAVRSGGTPVLALVGPSGGSIAREADVVVAVPGGDTPRIQEMHLVVIHIVCELVEKTLASGRAESGEAR